MMLEKVGGRKYLFAILVVVLGFVLVMTGKVDPKDWFGFVEIIGGSYILGNVVSKFSAKV